MVKQSSGSKPKAVLERTNDESDSLRSCSMQYAGPLPGMELGLVRIGPIFTDSTVRESVFSPTVHMGYTSLSLGRTLFLGVCPAFGSFPPAWCSLFLFPHAHEDRHPATTQTTDA